MALDITEIKIRDKVTIAGTEITSVETTLTGGNSALPRADAVKAYVDSLLNANDAMQFKGTIGTGGTVTALPTTHSAGWTYRVITAETYAGVVTEVGDLIIAIIDRAGTGNTNSDWTVVQTNIDGAVIGPSSSTSGNISTFNGTSGKLIQDSGVSFETTLTTNSDAKSPTSKAVATYVTGLGYVTSSGVTSVGLTAGTGISLSGTNPITSSGTITVTNSAPDQTVALTGAGSVSITGTYPNFTITGSGGASGDFLPLTGGTLTGGLNVELSAGGNSHIGLDVGSSTFNNYLTTTANGTTFFRSFTPSPATYTTRMVIKGDGNVGIGTDSPGGKLDVFGSGSNILKIRHDAASGGNWAINPYIVSISNAGLSFTDVKNSTTPMVISDGGNVGIGTTSPVSSSRLTITQMDANGSQIRMSNTAAGGNDWVMGVGSTSSTSSIVSAGSLFFYDTDSSSTRMLLDTNGNVGIGTTSPGAKLDVQGDLLINNPSVYGRINGHDTYHSIVLRGNISGTSSQSVVPNDSMTFAEYGGTFRFKQLTPSANTDLITLTPSGLYIGGSTNNGRIYADDWGIKVGTDSGHVWIGPANTGHAHIYTDRPNFYFNKDLLVNGSTVIHSGTIGSQSVNYATTSSQLHMGGSSTKLIADGVWAGGGSFPGYQFTGGNSRFGFSSTSGYIDVYTDGNFYAGIDFNGVNNLVWHAGNFNPGSYLTTSGKAADSNLLDGIDSSQFVRNDTYNSANAGFQVFRNIGTGTGSWQDGTHTFSLENSDAGNIAINFHRAGYSSHNILYNGSTLNFDLPLLVSGSTVIHSGNIGSQSVNYATNSGGISASSSASFVFSGSTFGSMNSSNFNPNGVMAKSLGASNAFWLGVWTCTIYRTSESGLSDVYSKKDIKNIVIDGVPIYQPESLKEIEVTEEEENFFEGVKTLFEKLTIYTFNYIGSETNKPDKIGVMAQEIEEVLEGYPLLLSLLIQEVSEEIKDNEGNIIETKVKKYLRTDNLDTLKTIMIKYIYFKVKNLEEAVKQANETIAKIKYVLVNKEVATEEELE
jgi:hypothetical protein